MLVFFISKRLAADYELMDSGSREMKMRSLSERIVTDPEPSKQLEVLIRCPNPSFSPGSTLYWNLIGKHWWDIWYIDIWYIDIMSTITLKVPLGLDVFTGSFQREKAEFLSGREAWSVDSSLPRADDGHKAEGWQHVEVDVRVEFRRLQKTVEVVSS